METARKRYNTTLDPVLLRKMEVLKAFLKSKGEKKDGVNELIEEGMEMVVDKYKKKYDLNLNGLL